MSLTFLIRRMYHQILNFVFSRHGRPQTSSRPPVILLLAVPRRLFCFGSLVVLDVVCDYVLLSLLDIKLKIGKK